MTKHKKNLLQLIKSRKFDKLLNLKSLITESDYLTRDEQGNNIVLLCCKLIIENQNNDEIENRKIKSFLYFLVQKAFITAERDDNFNELHECVKANHNGEGLLQLIAQIKNLNISRLSTNAIEHYLVFSDKHELLSSKNRKELLDFSVMNHDLLTPNKTFDIGMIQKYGYLALDFHLRNYGINNVGLITKTNIDTAEHLLALKNPLGFLASINLHKQNKFTHDHQNFIKRLLPKNWDKTFHHWFNAKDNYLNLEFFQKRFSLFAFEQKLEIDDSYEYFKNFFQDLSELYLSQSRIGFVNEALLIGYQPRAEHLHLNNQDNDRASLIDQNGCTTSSEGLESETDENSLEDSSQATLSQAHKKQKTSPWQSELRKLKAKKSDSSQELKANGLQI